ncbi:MAG: protein kinase, partial [Oscillospiraceae bacterium]|nr:protein kinase [Oscillospiraceae bacterium]
MEKKFCYRCMENYDGFKTVCPHCGYDENSSYNNMYLAPGTVLHERYLVGVLINFNGEGATYIAYDKVIDCKVLLREYMPVNLCTRVEGKPTISVNYNNLAKYKAFMAEYTELNKSLARLRNNTNINPTLDMFAENNTTYTIFEYIEGCKLLDYLKQNAGELTWEQVSKLLPPLFTTIGIIHNAGIIHRAISPDTVYVTSKGEIKLSGFCISSVRTIGGGLEPELFKGYAAPEQYSSNISSRQGTWTDVYGLSALLYRVLTGCMPTESIERTESDNLCEPYVLNKNIPKQVSRTIMDGLNVSGSNRIQTITEFVTRLFEQNDEDIKIRNTNSFNTRNIVHQVPEERASEYTKSYNINNNYNNYNNNPVNPPPEYSDTQRNYRNNYNDYNNGNNYSNNEINDYDYNYEDENPDSNSDNYEYEKVKTNTIDKIKIPLIIVILLFDILMILGITLMHV